MEETLIRAMEETLILKGTLHGHLDTVMAIATPIDNSDTIVSCSRDKSLIFWTLTKLESAETAGSAPYGVHLRRLIGHSDCVQDVVLSSDGKFALSGSWDGEIRLWDLDTGATTLSFVGHTERVLSVAFSLDNYQIVSASMDRTIKIWNTLGECKYTIPDADLGCKSTNTDTDTNTDTEKCLVENIIKCGHGYVSDTSFASPEECPCYVDIADGHSDWVSCVRFSPDTLHPTMVSGSCDRTVKVWNPTNRKLKSTLVGHGGHVHTVAVSPCGSLCVSGDHHGMILMWDLAEGKLLYSLDANANIHSLCFSPNRYWLCAATEECVKIWDLEGKFIVEELRPHAPTTTSEDEMVYCASLSWSCDGSTLFAGYTDGIIRVWEVSCSD